MVKLELFEVDHWILSRSSSTVKHNLAHSYCLPRSIGDLQRQTGDSDVGVEAFSPILSKALDYGPMKGSESLRSKISHWYSTESSGDLTIENIITTPGASLANFLVVFALLGPGDHVIVQYPTYQQLYSLPKSLGVDVSLWETKKSDDWKLDLEELRRLIQPNTKMLIISNPQNPTGRIIHKSTLEEIVKIAREHSMTIFSDEVYRPLFHSISKTDTEYPPSILSMGYENTVATSSLSKAYSFPGLRVGWVASHSSKAIDLCVNARSYALITASQIDEYLASLVLSPSLAQGLIERNCTLAKENLNVVQSFIDKNSSVCEWARPVGGPIGFIRFTRAGKPVDDLELCTALLEERGILLVPGRKCFGDGVKFSGYVRLGFGGKTEELKAALEDLQIFIQENYANVPLSTGS
ncbi:aspartate/tyrosine/aromatic aminotransferase [Talaromyces proteolyticus]|uniref:Aspartate/tyrosine/aromatic aminotransferase n=1 Tax=Talaromyces proteolyticus TaxID=1131652 RepID=A0AAD4KXB6_9EURO|nr:aspartate/tyrosine/aromatic aminotransferase [Talaromyces proteolyticus]KAH8703256.1 aspartate/tyrosine/aromatic aminotransferase [Talaromyces proteolyticus]